LFAREEAEYFRMPYYEFRKVASTLLRHAISERRYVYYRKELLGWRSPVDPLFDPHPTHSNAHYHASFSENRLIYGANAHYRAASHTLK
jgi:hypothetical protein